ncbi:beta-lactamase [Pusillimonas sp. T7-7]|uniref:serine hydrolase domain-containing protein n=1 Tax=Pusillimonas sp. (strain T7-7) TaxID=1007105 RepID=UPI0002085402|nr:serine hydrolase domain-containing protein [Pusillimonas sp. T7-7]AEC19663.1 beta-lactamase [Pusillimonas sp. T7-7]
MISPLRRRILQAALAGSLSVPLIGCESSDDSGGGDYASTIADAREAILQAMADSDTSSISVALVDGHHVVWREAFGVIDRVNNLPASTDTLYNIGSVSKVFVATAIMILVDRGLLELDASVTAYIRDFRMLSPAYAKITVRMLLSHSSGFPGSNYQNIFAFRPLSGYARDTQTLLAGMHLKHEPGELAVYCNDGFTMAERVVEEVSGKAYARFVTDEILFPLKMSRSRYSLEYYPADSFSPPYLDGRKQGQEFVCAYGTGGLSSTPAEMMRFAMMFINDGELDGQRILSRASIKQMGSDQTVGLALNPAPVWKWGLGWDCVEQPGLLEAGFTCWQKNGGTAFYGSEFFVLPKEALAIMITGASLSYGAGKLAERILLHALRDKHSISALPVLLPLVPPPAVLASDVKLRALEGYYASVEGVTKIVQDDARTLSLFAWHDGQWNAVASGLQLRSDGWFSADNSPRSYRLDNIGPYGYITARTPSGYGHYITSIPYAQSVRQASPISPAWQSRLGRSWLLVNEDESSVMLALESPLLTLRDIPELPGYVQIEGQQLLLPADDMRTRQFLKIPVNFGRDLNELIVQREADDEWLWFGGHCYRPVSSIPSVGVGTHVVQVDANGNAQCLHLIGAGSMKVVNSRAWRLYDAQWNSINAGEGNDNAVLSSDESFYLMIFGEPSSQAAVSLI